VSWTIRPPLGVAVKLLQGNPEPAVGDSGGSVEYVDAPVVAIDSGVVTGS